MGKKYSVCAKINNRWYAIVDGSLHLEAARRFYQDILLAGWFAGYKMELRPNATYDRAIALEFRAKINEDKLKFWS